MFVRDLLLYGDQYRTHQYTAFFSILSWVLQRHDDLLFFNIQLYDDAANMLTNCEVINLQVQRGGM